MNVLKIVLLTIQLSNVLSKKYASSSDESIENLLYFKDCQKKQKPKEQPKPEPMQLRQVTYKPKPIQLRQVTNKLEPIQLRQVTNKPEPMQLRYVTNKPEPIRLRQVTNKLEPIELRQVTNKPELMQLRQVSNKPELMQLRQVTNKPEPMQLRQVTNKQEPMQLREVSQPQRQFECPFPKMCCSLSCNNECGGDGPMSLFGRQENAAPSPIQPPFPPRQPQLPVQPPMQRGHKRKIKPLLPPIGGRREFGFTKEKIKSLIAKDDDIRKILKDLVRVTMQKVDLVEMIKTRRSEMNLEDNRKEVSNSDDDYDLE